MDTDLHTTALPQRLAAAWLSDGRHARHLERVIPIYRRRRDLLLAALERHLRDEGTWTLPQGGQHVWVTLRRAVGALRAHEPAALLLVRRLGAARRGRPPAGAGAPRGAPSPAGRRDAAAVVGDRVAIATGGR